MLVIAAPWEALFAFDFLIFILTFAKTSNAWKKHEIGGGVNLLALMFRDGVYLAFKCRLYWKISL